MYRGRYDRRLAGLGQTDLVPIRLVQPRHEIDRRLHYAEQAVLAAALNVADGRDKAAARRLLGDATAAYKFALAQVVALDDDVDDA